jgi:hypothetical protein
MDLPEKQHAGLAFLSQGSPNITSFPNDQHLQTACLLAISNKYGHLFIALRDSLLHTPTRKFHGELNPPIEFSTLSILLIFLLPEKLTFNIHWR